jgi:asparagine synthase (glutamine-hydrolysing)
VALRAVVSRIADLLPYSAYGKNYLRMISRPAALERYFESGSPHYLLQRLLTPEWMPPANAAFLARKMAHSLLPSGTDALTQALYFEATAKLTGDMLVKVDRMSMANSLEVRCPMLDHELAQLAARIPHAWKLKNGRGKDIFIRAVGHRLPPELLHQPKRGFGVPLASWLRGSLRNFVWDHLTSRVFLDRRMVSPEFVRHLLEEHDRGRRDNHHHLWKLLMLELWFQEDGRLRTNRTPAEAFAV